MNKYLNIELEQKKIKNIENIDKVDLMEKILGQNIKQSISVNSWQSKVKINFLNKITDIEKEFIELKEMYNKLDITLIDLSNMKDYSNKILNLKKENETLKNNIDPINTSKIKTNDELINEYTNKIISLEQQNIEKWR